MKKSICLISILFLGLVACPKSFGQSIRYLLSNGSECIDDATSPKNMSERIKGIRESLWGGGMGLQGTSLPLYNNEPSAIEYVEEMRKKAHAGDAEAQYKLGRCYDHGWGVLENDPQAIEWYLRAAANGCVEGLERFNYHLIDPPSGVCRQMAADICMAKYDKVKKLALKGNAEAQFELYKIYDCYSRFADDGELWDEDFVLPCSEEITMTWLKKSAANGWAEAQYELARYYYEKKDFSNAKHWGIEALRQGYFDFESCPCTGAKYNSPLPQSLNDIWYAAERGDADALCYLGYSYFMGDYKIVEIFSEELGGNCNHSLELWFRIKNDGISNFDIDIWSSDEGGEDSSFLSCYLSDEYFPVSVAWGYLFTKGNGIKRNDKEAVYYFTQASNKGHELAKYYLGCCYYFGIGVPANLEKALLLFRASGCDLRYLDWILK